MFAFAPSRTRRRPSLTPMIDVVFLLLIFFMLASQFGRDAAIDLAAGGDGADRQGPPRLVAVMPETLTLNGRPVTEEGLVDGLARLTESSADLIALRAGDGADVQRLMDVAQALRVAGYTGLVLVE